MLSRSSLNTPNNGGTLHVRELKVFPKESSKIKNIPPSSKLEIYPSDIKSVSGVTYWSNEIERDSKLREVVKRLNTSEANQRKKKSRQFAHKKKRYLSETEQDDTRPRLDSQYMEVQGNNKMQLELSFVEKIPPEQRVIIQNIE